MIVVDKDEYPCRKNMSETWEISEHGDLTVFAMNIHATVCIASYAAGTWKQVKRVAETHGFRP